MSWGGVRLLCLTISGIGTDEMGQASGLIYVGLAIGGPERERRRRGLSRLRRPPRAPTG